MLELSVVWLSSGLLGVDAEDVMNGPRGMSHYFITDARTLLRRVAHCRHRALNDARIVIHDVFKGLGYSRTNAIMSWESVVVHAEGFSCRR